MAQTLIVVNDYALTAPADRFTAAIAALAARVEAEGHPGVLSYRFFIAADDTSARAVIRYAGPEAWLGHHEISFPWPEMRALHGVATLSRVAFLGPLTAEIRAWIDASPLAAEISEYNRGTGFDRLPAARD